tara:strand:- start:1858 stop:2202 length:345 start_codon:yes stop_codon:yes gene_type:complete
MMDLISRYHLVLDDVEGFPRRVRTRWEGAVRISSNGEAIVQGKPTEIAVFAEAGEVERIVFSAETSEATIHHGLSLSDLSLEELQAAVSWADVTTSASTKAGLISAINNHLNGD